MLLKADKCRKEKEGNLCLHEEIISSPDPGGDIIYWFEKNHPGHILSRKQLRCVNDVKDRFLSYSALSTDETIALKNRIHVIINTSKFMALKRSTEEEIVDEGSGAKESLFKRLDEIEAKVDSQPRIFVGNEEPKDSREGDIWFQSV